MNIKHDKLDNAISEFNSNMKDSKNVLFPGVAGDGNSASTGGSWN